MKTIHLDIKNPEHKRAIAILRLLTWRKIRKRKEVEAYLSDHKEEILKKLGHETL